MRMNYAHGNSGARMSQTTNSKKPTNLSLDSGLINAARALEINLSKAAEDGVRVAVAREKAARWKTENLDAIESSNQWVETHGLPLERHKRF
jgi:antitoxin CcdA